jgi:hypothetical protein
MQALYCHLCHHPHPLLLLLLLCHHQQQQPFQDFRSPQQHCQLLLYGLPVDFLALAAATLVI